MNGIIQDFPYHSRGGAKARSRNRSPCSFIKRKPTSPNRSFSTTPAMSSFEERVQKPKSSPSWIAIPICSTPPRRPLYHKSHFFPS